MCGMEKAGHTRISGRTGQLQSAHKTSREDVLTDGGETCKSRTCQASRRCDGWT